jgi:hypothetical protein
MQLKSILRPIDFSEFSVAAYEYALSVADYYKASLVALHIAELSNYPSARCAASWPGTPRSLQPANTAERTQELRQIISQSERKILP